MVIIIKKYLLFFIHKTNNNGTRILAKVDPNTPRTNNFSSASSLNAYTWEKSKLKLDIPTSCKTNIRPNKTTNNKAKTKSSSERIPNSTFGLLKNRAMHKISKLPKKAI